MVSPKGGAHEMKLDDYIESINNFEKMNSLVFREFWSDFKGEHKFDFNDESSLFYAKGFGADTITDELYYFSEKHVKIVELKKGEKGKLMGTSILIKKTSDIKEVELTLTKNRNVKLSITFSDDLHLNFDNVEDSKSHSKYSIAEQLKAIYKLLTK